MDGRAGIRPQKTRKEKPGLDRVDDELPLRKRKGLRFQRYESLR